MRTDIEIGECRQAAWFEELTDSKQSHAIDVFTKTMHDAIDGIAGRIALPNVIEIIFSSERNMGRGAYACAFERRVWFSKKTYDKLLGEGDALLGLCAHELSHVSDFETYNDCRTGEGWREFIVSEGKAENVAIEIAGDDYIKQLCTKSPSDEEIEKAFSSRRDFSRYFRKIDSKKKYAVSAAFVDRVKKHFDISVFQLHRWSTECIIEQFEAAIGVTKTR